MHHKYVVRDRSAVWTGSTNWTHDSWTREENVIVSLESRELANRYLDDFEQLWAKRNVMRSGRVGTAPVTAEGRQVRAWFCPGRGDKLAHRIAKAIGAAQRRVRIASPVISSGPILGTLAQVASDGKVDLAGVVDLTQVREVIHQWQENRNAEWKEPLLRAALTRAPFSGKVSTPYSPGSIHDYMHAKLTVADDRVFVGSFNLSHSGEMNAENVLEIADAALADRLAAFVDEVRGRYAPIELRASCSSPERVSLESYGTHTRRPRDSSGGHRFSGHRAITSGRYEPDQRSFEMIKATKALAKRRTLFAVVLALTIFGAVYGFAATLNVGTDTLSAGNATVASCQTSGSPTGTYTTAYDSTRPRLQGQPVSSSPASTRAATARRSRSR